MDINEARYLEDGSIHALLEDGGELYIPPSEDNPQYVVLMEWVAAGNEIHPYEPPPAPEEVTVVRKLDYFSRMTNEEADIFQQGAQTRPYRERAMLDAATQFESSHELWALLWQMNVDAFGEERAAELLAPS